MKRILFNDLESSVLFEDLESLATEGLRYIQLFSWTLVAVL